MPGEMPDLTSHCGGFVGSPSSLGRVTSLGVKTWLLVYTMLVLTQDPQIFSA